MDLQNLCTNCLTGTLKNGVCTYCHKNVLELSERRLNTLPDRYMLAERYYLGRIIGKGGFGITYLAWDCLRGERVIVKELYPDRDVQRNPMTHMVIPVRGQEKYFEKCRQRFKEEAQILYNFRNEPSVLNVYQLVEANNTVYYSMEYLSGFDLKSYIQQQGKLGWPQLSGYIKKILYTLRILHGRNLIHRDISPDNIFLVSQTEAKLIDFGSVRCYNSERGLTTILKQVYAPPEQYFTNGNQGPWTDVYSLSVTMYYALSGTHPAKAMTRVNRDDTIPIGELCPGLPTHVAEGITRGMQLREDRRFQSAEAMAKALFPGEDIFSGQNGGSGSSGSGASQQYGTGWQLLCIAGYYHGRQIRVASGSNVRFGRDSQCEVCYPADSPGISRNQCRLWCDAQGRLFIQDTRSSYGTCVSGRRLKADQWYRLDRGNVITFAGESYCVE